MRSTNRRTSALVMAAMLAASVAVLGGTPASGQTVATRLDCTPENTVRPTGSTLTITCTATDSSGEGVAGVPIDFEATIVGDPDASNSPDTPDFTCTTDPNGTCSISHGPNTAAPVGGEDITRYRAWIDEDGGPAVEADLAEGRDEGPFPGDDPEPDGTDVVENTWRYPETVDAEVETRTSAIGSTETIAVTVYDNAGNPFVAPITVKFEFFAGSPSRPTDGNTPASPDMTCTTSIQGICSVSWKNKTSGTDLICVWAVTTPPMFGTNTNGTCGNSGEGLSDQDDAPGVFDPPDNFQDRVDVVQRTRS